jgi:iron complex transport system substrate-binding protein
MVSMMVLLIPPSMAAAIEIVDDLGRKVSLGNPAKRIIALYGAYNEILFAMGLEDRIIARTKADQYPPSIVSMESIGTHMRPNVELVVSLKPDIVLQGGGRKDGLAQVGQLMDHGITVAVFNPTDFSGIFSSIRRIGILTGEESKADDLVSSLENRLGEVRNRLNIFNKYSPTIFFEVRYPNLLTVGEESLVNEIIELAGGRNCIKVNKKLVRTSLENVIASNPDFYVVQTGPMNRDPQPPAERENFGSLKCVRQGKVVFVDEQVFSRPGPRSVDAVETLSRFLHPEAFEPVNLKN